MSFLPSGGGGTPSSPVAITGVSGLSVTQLGKNLCPKHTSETIGNVTFTVNPDGSISVTGTNGSSRIIYYMASNVFLKAGDYTLSGCPSGGSAQTWELEIYPSTGTVTYYRDYGSGKTFTLTEDKEMSFAFVLRANQATEFTIYPMLEVGSTATTYSAYVTPSVVTDTFGQTIMGGTRDLTTDKASVTADLFALDDANITWDYRADNKVFRSSVLSISQILLCSCFGVETYSHVYNNAETYDNCIAISSGKRLFVSYQGAGGDVNAFKSAISGQKLVVGLDTPTEITGLTPHEIDTLYGDNNIYADTGTTAVEYRADIDLALNA